MGLESSHMIRLDLGPLLYGQARTLKDPYNSLNIGPGCDVKSWAESLLMWSDLTLGSSKVKKGSPNLKSAYNSLSIGPRGLGCETDLWEIMGLESSDVIRFDLGPLALRSNMDSQT